MFILTPTHARTTNRTILHILIRARTTTTLTGGIKQFCLEAATSNGENTGTSDSVNVEFYVGQAWSSKQLFFKGAAPDETRMATFTLTKSTATKVRLTIDGGDGWAFWRIKFGGVIIHENPDGAVRPEYKTGSRFWIGGDSTDGQISPASIELDLSSTFSLCSPL